MVAVPFLIPLIVPLLLTVQTDFLLLDHFTFFLVPFTFSFAVFPTVSVTFFLFSFGAASACILLNPRESVRHNTIPNRSLTHTFFMVSILIFSSFLLQIHLHIANSFVCLLYFVIILLFHAACPSAFPNPPFMNLCNILISLQAAIYYHY